MSAEAVTSLSTRTSKAFTRWGTSIRSIYGTVQQSLSTLPSLKAHIAKWSPLLPSKIGSVDLPTGASTWQVLLSEAFDDLIGIADDRRILMLWDEFPLMLHNLQRREGADSAIQLLDYLRALRLARADRLRFLFTGSIGLHLVLRSLRKAGNANDPVNDMLSLTVPPLAQEDTCDLAATLLEETHAAPAQIPDLASRIAGEVGGFPYYVHHVVDQLNQLRRPPTLHDVSSAVDTLVYDSQDPANLNLLRDTTVFVLRRRRPVARFGRTRHHGRSVVAGTRPGAPQSVQAPGPVAGG